VLAKVSQETAGEHGGHHAITDKFLHEQIPETGIYRIQRHHQGQQVVADRGPARVTAISQNEKACGVKNFPAGWFCLICCLFRGGGAVSDSLRGALFSRTRHKVTSGCGDANVFASRDFLCLEGVSIDLFVCVIVRDEGWLGR